MIESTVAPSTGARRVVLGLEEAGAPDFLFELAATLARGHSGSLVAQVRENLDLHAAAALPFVRLIDRHSAATREWTPAQAAQARSRTERQWQQRLAELARVHALQAQLEWVRGSRQEYLRGGLASPDVLVLGSGRGAAQEGVLRIAAALRPGHGEVDVIAAAQSLSEAMRAGLHLLHSLPSEAGTASLPHTARAARVNDGLAAVIAAAIAARAQILVLPRGLCGEDAPGLVQAFLARPGRCVVVLP